MKGFTTFQPSSSMETPMTARPLSLYLFWYSMNQGISVPQPWHQVAQKSSSTTFPLYPDNFSGAPLESSRVKSGAILRELSDAEAGTLAGKIVHKTNSAAANAIPADIGRSILELPPD